MLLPASVAPPSSLQEDPPLVLYRMPMRGPPRLATSPLPPMKPFEVMPVPAIRTLGLRRIERKAGDRQRPLVVAERRPARAAIACHPDAAIGRPDIHRVGVRRIGDDACTTPEVVPLGGASALWMVPTGPKLGDGPIGTKVWAGAVVAQTLARAATSRAARVLRRRNRNKAITRQRRKPHWLRRRCVQSTFFAISMPTMEGLATIGRARARPRSVLVAVLKSQWLAPCMMVWLRSSLSLGS